MTPTNTIHLCSAADSADDDRMLGRATAESLCQVTIILRYYPEHAEAMEPLKEWVRDFQITP